MNYKKVLFWVFLYATAMGYLESAVVVYLRELLYPAGFDFPLKTIPGNLLIAEVIREFATIIMILAVAILAGRTKLEKFAYFCFVFGIWDIVYYIGLKAILNWPANFFTMDVLFFIPVVWVGPVLAPVIVSAALCATAIIIIYFSNNNIKFYNTWLLWSVEITGGVIVFLSFLTCVGDVIKNKYPEHFYWPLFTAGIVIGFAAFCCAVYRTVKKSRKSGTVN